MADGTTRPVTDEDVARFYALDKAEHAKSWERAGAIWSAHQQSPLPTDRHRLTDARDHLTRIVDYLGQTVQLYGPTVLTIDRTTPTFDLRWTDEIADYILTHSHPSPPYVDFVLLRGLLAADEALRVFQHLLRHNDEEWQAYRKTPNALAHSVGRRMYGFRRNQELLTVFKAVRQRVAEALDGLESGSRDLAVNGERANERPPTVKRNYSALPQGWIACPETALRRLQGKLESLVQRGIDPTAVLLHHRDDCNLEHDFTPPRPSADKEWEFEKSVSADEYRRLAPRRYRELVDRQPFFIRCWRWELAPEEFQRAWIPRLNSEHNLPDWAKSLGWFVPASEYDLGSSRWWFTYGDAAALEELSAIAEAIGTLIRDQPVTHRHRILQAFRDDPQWISAYDCLPHLPLDSIRLVKGPGCWWDILSHFVLRRPCRVLTPLPKISVYGDLRVSDDGEISEVGRLTGNRDYPLDRDPHPGDWFGPDRPTYMTVEIPDLATTSIHLIDALIEGWNPSDGGMASDLDHRTVSTPVPLNVGDRLRDQLADMEIGVRAQVSADKRAITLEDGTTHGIDANQGIYLDALILADDWMTDPQFRQLRPEVGDTARPDRWRAALPPEIQSRIEKGGSKGQRWRKLT